MGFRGREGQKIHPNFAPNITMEVHYHAFCIPDLLSNESGEGGPYINYYWSLESRGVSKGVALQGGVAASLATSVASLRNSVLGTSKVSRCLLVNEAGAGGEETWHLPSKSFTSAFALLCYRKSFIYREGTIIPKFSCIKFF